MSLSGLILKLAYWKVDITQPDYPKSIVCVAPHTSNWDFVLCKLAYAAAGRKVYFLMKESWFFFPLGIVLRAIGGIPVPRRNKKREDIAGQCDRGALQPFPPTDDSHYA